MCTVSDMRKSTANKHIVSSEELKIIIQIRIFLNRNRMGQLLQKKVYTVTI